MQIEARYCPRFSFIVLASSAIYETHQWLTSTMARVRPGNYGRFVNDRKSGIPSKLIDTTLSIGQILRINFNPQVSDYEFAYTFAYCVFSYT